MMKKEQRPFTYTTTQMVLAILFSSLFFVVVGMMLMGLIALVWPTTGGFTDTIADFILMNAPHLMLFLGVLLSAKWLLHTPLRLLVTDRPRFSWRLTILSFAVAMAVLTVTSIPLFFMTDAHFLQGVWSKRLLMLPFILLLTPIQTVAEELFFRVLPARLVFRGRMEPERGHMLLLCIVSGILFLLPHLANTEFSLTDNPVALLAYYFIAGFGMMYVSLYTKGFECAFGLHTAINLFTFLILGYEGALLDTYPLFIIGTMNDPMYDNSVLILLFAIVTFAVTLAAKKGFLGDNKVVEEGENG